jgi:hypothetical protein
MDRRLLFALSLSLIIVLSACSAKREGSVTILQPGVASPLNAPSRPAATTLELESPKPNAFTDLQFQLAPHGITIHQQLAEHPATSIVKLEFADPNAVRELQYVLAPFGVTIHPER